jgi:threonine/homoserine/homoserine lactone efflux protein
VKARKLLDKIDRGYDDGVATSNFLMGVIICALGLVALSVEAEWLQSTLAVLAGLVFVLFGWRMILSFRRQTAAADRKKSRNG